MKTRHDPLVASAKSLQVSFKAGDLGSERPPVHFAKEYLRNCASLTPSPTPWMASPHLTGKTLDVITVTDVEAYRTQRVSGKKGVSQRTADADLSRLKRLFSLCQTWGLCETNPVKSVKFFNPECMRERFISTEEEALLIEHAPRDLRNCITFAVNTGLRLREMLTLTWGQVDLKRGLVTVSADVAKNKKTRHVPLNDSAKAVLESLPRNIDPNALVFPKYGGEVFGKRSKDARSFYKAWQKTRDAAIADELDGHELCWHTLRHTFASRLVIAGVPLNAVQQLMGHRSIQMVMRYAHLAPDHLKNAVHLLDSKLQFSCTRPQPAETEKAP